MKWPEVVRPEVARPVLHALLSSEVMNTAKTKPKQYIGNREIAKIIGTDAATVRSYRRYGYLPEPEVMIEDRPGWTVETIKRWQAGRPGLNRRPYTKTPRPGTEVAAADD